jgi:cobyrinic acid a,c-diamide synthase
MIQCPRLIIAGLGGDSGKTAVSVGLCRFWQQHGLKAVPFKKGPDYIDMAWLNYSAKRPCYNLDLFLMSRHQILSSFMLNSEHADIAVIEGNRGLYDGLDEQGSVSTAEVAKLLQSPVILIADCTKITRTMAALVRGCQVFDPEVPIKGVIMNKLATPRHESVIRRSIEQYCDIPVVGAIPKLTDVTFPGRHLGLIPPQEHPSTEQAITSSAEIIKKYLDMETVMQIARQAPSVLIPSALTEGSGMTIKTAPVKIGVIRDSAFQFYYQENIDSLRKAGAEVILFSALTDDLPDSLDALYIGGGFPETHAERLSANKKMLSALKRAADNGLPIYAECGGLMYLGEALVTDGKSFPMTGIFPITFGVHKKPQGHGYAIAEVVSLNPFFEKGITLKGHEFHYSHVLGISENNFCSFAFNMIKGNGIVNKIDGIFFRNVLATYMHLHAAGTPAWVDGIIRNSLAYHEKKLIN